MPVVHFVKQNCSVQCPVGTNLRELARAHRIDLDAFPHNLLHCRRLGLCGCRVKVDNPSSLSSPTPAEEGKTLWEGDQYRLACQCRVLADVSVVTNPRRSLGWHVHPTYATLSRDE